MLGRIALVVSIALALSACGSSLPRSAKRTPPANETVAKGESSLRVRHVIDPHSPPVYIEGAVWHVRVLDSNGAAVIDRQLFDRQTSVRLRPGEYRLESEELPCSVNCDRLTPATDACAADFVAEPGGEVVATVTVWQARGCRIDLGA